ncbi:Uncharacterised protein [Vibrio cholerae]|nr:Uncharacterised protein [Vibrio cholerae]
MMVCCFLHKVIPRLPSVMQISSCNRYPRKFGRIISPRTPPPMKQTIGLVRYWGFVLSSYTAASNPIVYVKKWVTMSALPMVIRCW